MPEHRHDRSGQNRRALSLALAITALFFVVETVGGILTHSLALLGDAGHQLSDVGAIGLSLFAIWLAARPHAPERTFGYHRAEIVAALANGLTLLAVSAYIFWEAAHRFADPPNVHSGPMLVIAAAGLTANSVSGVILGRAASDSLNVRSALIDVLGDAAAAVGAIAAAIVMLTTGWLLADPLISVVIGLLILLSGARVTRDALRIFLEFVPGHVDMDEVRNALLSIEGVTGVHDLHVWTITSGFVTLSCHAQLKPGTDASNVLRAATAALTERFGIRHVTIQPEPEPMHGGTGQEACCLDEHAVESLAGDPIRPV
jgi:cobalt-zinc-cadmium efflux system protein